MSDDISTGTEADDTSGHVLFGDAAQHPVGGGGAPSLRVNRRSASLSDDLDDTEGHRALAQATDEDDDTEGHARYAATGDEGDSTGGPLSIK